MRVESDDHVEDVESPMSKRSEVFEPKMVGQKPTRVTNKYSTTID